MLFAYRMDQSNSSIQNIFNATWRQCFEACWWFNPHADAGTWNGAIVAVKVLAHTVENEKMGEQIEREVKFMTELKHPNIVHQYQAATRMVRSKSQLVSAVRMCKPHLWMENSMEPVGMTFYALATPRKQSYFSVFVLEKCYSVPDDPAEYSIWEKTIHVCFCLDNIY